jgi:two-component system chemotaxis response regulator CheB
VRGDPQQPPDPKKKTSFRDFSWGTQLRVKEAFEGCPVQSSEALLAPAGRHLSFRRAPDGQVVVQLSLQPMDKPHRPSVDVLFESAAETYHNRVLGVVIRQT